MTRSPSAPGPGLSLRPVWQQRIAGQPLGLSVAREKDWLLLWDDRNGLHLWNHAGRLQGHTTLPKPVSVACVADDGSTIAAASSKGDVWWLTPDLTIVWKFTTYCPVRALALDPFGNYLAAADARGQLHVVHRGRLRTFFTDVVRPLHFLAFVPQQPFLVGSADFGLVVCLDQQGKTVWQDGLVAHVGGLAVNGDGSRIVLACFSDGLRAYAVNGQHPGRFGPAEVCRLLAMSYDGRALLVADMGNQLRLLDGDGRPLATHHLDQPPVSIALGPLADHAWAALVDGSVVGLEVR